MRTLSRHLPSPEALDGKMPFVGKIIVTSFFAAIGCWIVVAPYEALIILGSLTGLIAISMLRQRRWIARFRQERADTICDFRKSFNLREVDPWIIRATHEAFGAWLDPKQPCFPLRASDSIGGDLKIHPEDMGDLVFEVAERAGYDLSHCDANPLFGKVQTVEDFVLFINMEPRTREAEQARSSDGG